MGHRAERVATKAANWRCSSILTQYPFPGWNCHLPCASGGSGCKKASSIQCALHVLVTRGVKCIVSYPMERVQVRLHPNYVQLKIKHYWDFPGSPVVKNFSFPTVEKTPLTNAGDLGLILDLGRLHMGQSN